MSCMFHVVLEWIAGVRSKRISPYISMLHPFIRLLIPGLCPNVIHPLYHPSAGAAPLSGYASQVSGTLIAFYLFSQRSRPQILSWPAYRRS